jgi:hypothetical protein
MTAGAGWLPPNPFAKAARQVQGMLRWSDC